MQFECQNPECKKQFLHAAKKTVTKDIDADIITETETHVCPYCESLDIALAPVAPTPEKASISSIISVPIEQADTKISEGYEMLEAFAKTVTLVKRKPKEELKL